MNKSNLKCWQIYGNLLFHDPFGVVTRTESLYTVNIVDLAIYFKTTTRRMCDTLSDMAELSLIEELKFHPTKKKELPSLCSFRIFLPIGGAGAMSNLTTISSKSME